MDNPLRMNIIKRNGQITKPTKNTVLVQSIQLDVGKRPRPTIGSKHQIHDEIRQMRAFVNVQIKDANDARILQSGKQLAFCEVK